MKFLDYGIKNKKDILILYFSYLIINFLEIFGIGLIPLFVILISSPELIINKFNLNNYFSITFENFDENKLIIYFSIFFIIFFIFKNILSIIFFSLEKNILSKIITSNALKIYSYYLEKSFQTFQDSKSSEIIKNISHSNTQAGMAMQGKLMLLKELTFLIFLFFGLLFVNYKVTIISILFLIICGSIFFFIFKKKIIKTGSQVEENQQEQIEILNQTFLGFREIVIFQIKNFMTKKFFYETRNLNEKNFLNHFYQRLPRVFYEIIAIIMIVILVYFLIVTTNNNELVFPILSLYAVSFIRLVPSFTIINSSLKNINFLRKPEKIVNNILMNYHTISQKINSMTTQVTKESFKINKIELENIYFKYDENIKRFIFKDFSLNIQKGDKICIMGESGRGKSTLIDLIIGLIQPQKGKVKINQLLNKYDSELVYSRIGYVPQKVFLFNDTILNNLFFDKNKSEQNLESLNSILKELKLIEFINSLPSGLETKVGNMGSKLSGGQLQRIGIARALLRDPDLIILDESTNSLDEEMEKNILSIFTKEKYKDKIVICISHNKKNIQFFDKLIDLKDDQILIKDIRNSISENY